MSATTYTAPDAEIVDLADGRYYRWRFKQALADVGDAIKFPFPGGAGGQPGGAKLVTLTYAAFSDPAAASTTTFTPEVGTAASFVNASIDGRAVSPTADAPSRSQTPLVLDCPDRAIWIRPVPSGTCTPWCVVIVREGHRV